MVHGTRGCCLLPQGSGGAAVWLRAAPERKHVRWSEVQALVDAHVMRNNLGLCGNQTEFQTHRHFQLRVEQITSGDAETSLQLLL